MYRKRIISLISETYTQDDIGQTVAQETKTDVIAQVDSVSASEFFEAGQVGITPEFRFTLNRYAYNGQKIIAFGGHRFGVYRTYEASPFTIELYASRKDGV